MRIFLAGDFTGALTSDEIDDIYSIMTYRLDSFFYRQKFDRERFWERDRPRVKEFMLDSGAFSWFAMHGDFKRAVTKRKGTADVAEYTHDYCKWLVENKDKIDYYIEMDVDKIFGWEKQQELRDIFQTYNLDPIHVHHPTNKWAFEDYCKKFEFVGIGSTYSTVSTAIPRLRLADKYGVKCHMFGFTAGNNLKVLTRHPSCYSVDSSSWLGGIRYGASQYFNGQNIVPLKTKTDISRRINAMTRAQKLAYSVRQWQAFSDHLEELSGSKV